MIFGRLFNVDLSRWEEQVLATALLLEIKIEKGMFLESVVDRMQIVLDEIKLLPCRWMRELSLEILMES